MKFSVCIAQLWCERVCLSVDVTISIITDPPVAVHLRATFFSEKELLSVSFLCLKYTVSSTWGWEMDLPSSWQSEDWVMPSLGSTWTCSVGPCPSVLASALWRLPVGSEVITLSCFLCLPGSF